MRQFKKTLFGGNIKRIIGEWQYDINANNGFIIKYCINHLDILTAINEISNPISSKNIDEMRLLACETNNLESLRWIYKYYPAPANLLNLQCVLDNENPTMLLIIYDLLGCVLPDDFEYYKFIFDRYSIICLHLLSITQMIELDTDFSVLVADLLIYSGHFNVCREIHSRIIATLYDNRETKKSELINRFFTFRNEFRPYVRTPHNMRFYFN